MKQFIYILIPILSACMDGKKQDQSAGEEHASHGVATVQDDNALMLSDTQMKLANITTSKVSRQPVGETLTLNARLVADEDRTRTISSRVSGRIEKLYFKETGRIVQAGEPLYEIYSEALLTLQREYMLALEQNQTLGNEKERYATILKAAGNKLLLYGLTQKQLDQLAITKALTPRVTFVAPSGGFIEDLPVVEGQYVNEGDLLYRLENIASLWVEADLYPHEAQYASIGTAVAVRVAGFETEPVTARISFLSPEFERQSQVIRARMTLSNPGFRFKPGMHAQVELLHSAHVSLALPTDAVIRDAKGSHVYVQTGTNTFLPRMVRTGLEDVDLVEIVDGLEEDEVVAVTGAYLLYSELILKKGVDPMAGHSHSHEYR